MSKVFHDKNFLIDDANMKQLRSGRKFPDDFVLVAECDSEELDEIFQLTNSIDRVWWLNEGVKKTVSAARSTSVGDVVVLSDGTAFVCRGFGWDLIGNMNESDSFDFKSGLFS